jgi:RHS repeat-associated protein
MDTFLNKTNSWSASNQHSTNRLKTVVDWAGRTTTYAWDSAGRLTGITRPNGVSRANQYDNANRLERIYERDSAGRLLVYFKYSHDDDGRITSRYRLPQPQPFTVPASVASYDADNRLEFWNSQSVIHDADGNMTSGPLSAAGFVSYNYDARNRLTSVGTAGSGFTYHGYDSENNRVSVTNPAGVTRYLVDPHGDALPRILVREKPDASTTSYVYGIGLLYEVNDATGDAAYYHFDNIGNTAAVTGPTGTITDRVEYTPYGKIAYRSGTTDTPFLYVGQLGVMQEANGLIYMRARYYAPETQRFVNADPIGFGGGMNWYAYANGNPVMFVDPTGLDAWTSTMGGLRAVGGGFQVFVGYSLATASGAFGVGTSWTGVGAVAGAAGVVGGVAVGAHGLDNVQAGLRQMWTGEHVDSVTSQGLQAAGMSQQAANLTDAGLGIVGSAGAGLATTGFRAATLATTASPAVANASILTQIKYYEAGQTSFSGSVFNTTYGNISNTLDRGAQILSDYGSRC